MIEIYMEWKKSVLVNPKLHHSGRTFVIEKQSTDPKKKIVYSFKEVKQDKYFEDLIICQQMFALHNPPNYNEGLKNDIIFN